MIFLNMWKETRWSILDKVQSFLRLKDGAKKNEKIEMLNGLERPAFIKITENCEHRVNRWKFYDPKIHWTSLDMGGQTSFWKWRVFFLLLCAENFNFFMMKLLILYAFTFTTCCGVVDKIWDNGADGHRSNPVPPFLFFNSKIF